MAITQISKIQVRSGSTDNIPQLSLGELGWAYTGPSSPQLLIGGDGSNVTSNVLPDNVEILTEFSANIPAGGANTQVQFNNNGILSGIPSVTWNGSNLSLGNVANVKIAGGVNGYVLQTDGSGNLSWTAQTGGGGNGVPGGANTQVQFNDSGTFGASSAFTFDTTTATLSATRVAGSLTTAAQPNITSVGTLTSLAVNGNITAANITANTGIFTGNGSGITALNGSNISTGTIAQARLANSTLTLGSTTLTLGATTTSIAGLTSVSATTFTGSLSGAATTAGTVTTNAQPNITSVGTLSSLSVTGNLSSGNANLGNLASANFISGNGSLLSAITGANVTGTVADATFATTAGTANAVAGGNVSGQVANALVAGTVYTAAQPNITSVGTLSSLSVTGNITGGNASLGNVASANFLTGTLTTSAQPNITSVGTLTGLTVNGTSNLGNVGNVIIAGGSSGQVLITNGSGNLSWATVASGAGEITITDDTSTNSTFYPTFTSATSGNVTGETVSSTKLTFNPGTGFLSATNFNSLSDINYKTNLAKIENALDAIDKINGYTFDWLDGAGSDTGVVAQEVEQAIPNSVTDVDGRKTVKYSAITAYLLQAVKELKQEIEILKSERK